MGKERIKNCISCVFRYAGVNFTKNIEKYIKHKPDEVSAIIDRFFDVAA